MLALLHLDLDRFKGINDAFGKEFGSELLREVAVPAQGPADAATSCWRGWRATSSLILQTGIKRPDDAAELAPPAERGLRRSRS